MHDPMDTKTHKLIERWMHGHTNQLTHKHMNAQTQLRTDTQLHEPIDA